MPVKERKLFHIDQRILHLKALEKTSQKGFPLLLARVKTYGHLLYYEFLKNDVAIRAESLSYLTIFSVMPLIAGIFFFMNLFSEWAPVQHEFEHFLKNSLQAIPNDQRDILVQYIFQFKDQYLSKIENQSGSIGILAFGILVWIAGKVFFNLEALMNRIWAVKRDRPFLERIQNFIFSIIIFPFAYSLALSLPGIIRHFGQHELGRFLHHGIPTFILFSSLTFVFRYFPNTKVEWRSALTGAFVTTAGLSISNLILGIYFKFGTQTAYGKVGIIPIFALFIYVMWMIFMLGVEVSLLCQLGERYEEMRLPQTTLAQALVLERTVAFLSDRFSKNLGPIETADLSRELNVGHYDSGVVFRFLRAKDVIRTVSQSSNQDHHSITLARVPSETDLIDLIKEFLDLTQISQNFDVNSLLSRLK